MITFIDYSYKPEHDTMSEQLDLLHDKAEKLGFTCLYFNPTELENLTMAGKLNAQEHLIKCFYEYLENNKKRLKK